MILLRGGKSEDTPVEQIVRRRGIKGRVGIFFKSARLNCNLSSRQIETAAGLEEGEYQSWEAGFTVPELERVLKIEGLLGAKVVSDYHLLCCRFGSEIATDLAAMRCPTSS